MTPFVLGTTIGSMGGRSRALVAALGTCLVLLAPGAAQASCVTPSATGAARAQALSLAALGVDVPGDLAFVGSVRSRGTPVLRAGNVSTPVTFDVAVGLRQVRTAELTVLTLGGTVGGTSTMVEDAPSYRTGSLYLVLGAREAGGGVVDVSSCTVAGPVTVADVRTLVRSARAPYVVDPRFGAATAALPRTGGAVGGPARTGSWLLALGTALLLLGAVSGRGRHAAPGWQTPWLRTASAAPAPRHAGPRPR